MLLLLLDGAFEPPSGGGVIVVSFLFFVFAGGAPGGGGRRCAAESCGRGCVGSDSPICFARNHAHPPDFARGSNAPSSATNSSRPRCCCCLSCGCERSSFRFVSSRNSPPQDGVSDASVSLYPDTSQLIDDSTTGPIPLTLHLSPPPPHRDEEEEDTEVLYCRLEMLAQKILKEHLYMDIQQSFSS